MDDYEKLSLADSSREEFAEDLFGDYKHMTPEEWVARYAHTVGCSSFGDFKYRNPDLGRWIHRLHQILSLSRQLKFPDEINNYRKQYLSAEEIAKIERISF